MPRFDNPNVIDLEEVRQARRMQRKLKAEVEAIFDPKNSTLSFRPSREAQWRLSWEASLSRFDALLNDHDLKYTGDP